MMDQRIVLEFIIQYIPVIGGLIVALPLVMLLLYALQNHGKERQADTNDTTHDDNDD